MSFVTKHQQATLTTTKPNQAADAAWSPIAPPYVSTQHYGDTDFAPPTQTTTPPRNLNPFPGWQHSLGDDEFLVDL